jgi:hypothetical protein
LREGLPTADDGDGALMSDSPSWCWRKGADGRGAGAACESQIADWVSVSGDVRGADGGRDSDGEGRC